MKKLLIPSVALAVFVVGCQPPPAGGGGEMLERLEKLEKKVAALEKRKPAAARKRPERKPQTAAYKIPLGDSYKMGSASAPVNVVIFSDYQCPYCARVDPFLHDLVKDPELKDKVNVTFKHFPLSFHKDAKPASKAALAAGEQGKFWEMSKKLYSDQRNLKPDNFKKWAAEIGLDVARFESDMQANDAKYEAIITKDMSVGQSAAKVRGTPSLFVNGWELRQRSVAGVKNIIKTKKLL